MKSIDDPSEKAERGFGYNKLFCRNKDSKFFEKIAGNVRANSF